MCGIAGILARSPRPLGPTLARMTRALAHRGPDGEGFVALHPGITAAPRALDTPPVGPARVFLGHRRLSIIDLAGSRQPLANEDGTVWVVFNGEIYNYKELACDLAARGHVLREKGDTEVLVHLYEEYGENLFTHLSGMFALALYDVRRDLLLLGRDRFGEKPLYYWRSDDLFAFASELQGLWSIENFPVGRIDPLALAQYFRYGYIPHPLTAYSDVRCLGPGESLIFQNSTVRTQAYYTPKVQGGLSADIDEFEFLLDQAVASRMVADVPVGCFLSGGLDSSLVASSMAKADPRSVRTFTIRLGDSDLDESAQARAIATHLGAAHAEHLVTPDFTAVVEHLALHYGQPFADYSCVPTYYVSRETRRQVKVALSGDGGDELFAGYERYANLGLGRRLGLAPAGLRAFLAALPARLGWRSPLTGHLRDFALCAGDLPGRGENHTSLFHRHWRSVAFRPAFCEALDEVGQARFRQVYEQASGQPLERWLEADQRLYLPDDILTKVDVASMAVSLETRAPLLDHRLCDWANAAAFSDKLASGKGKRLMRRLAARRLPHVVAKAPKKGFTLPLARWLREDLRVWAKGCIDEQADVWSPFLRPEAVECFWSEHQTGLADHSMRLWLVVSLALWARTRGKTKGVRE